METVDFAPSIPLELHTTNGSNIDYITIVSVGANDSSPRIEQTTQQTDGKDYITVLKIGTDDQPLRSVTEEVLVYRLPGEKLGFGLKFEGGTKSAEFVKRLFIQSCATNSPASRVQSSWGSLVEGDEILEIDSVPVNAMTRIDCVKCLKDSNVVIKLLIIHRFENNNIEPNADDSCTRSTEDLPLVISAEKKRTTRPPPPPPVPPRKINRKGKENSANVVIPPKGFGDFVGELNTSKQNHEIISNNVKNHRLQSPYNSLRKQRQSPEVIKRVRKLSDDMSCPPNAEVYIDLFSQESAYSLSESDDTGSSISTVVDKIGSYPTTTNSSFAGSLPSTPTPIQRHIYLTDDFDFNNDNYLFSKLITSQPNDDEEVVEDLILEKEKSSKPLGIASSDSTPIQPPTNFQDAPLSYGNEDVKIVKSELRINLNIPDRKITHMSELVCNKAPSPPPRTKFETLMERNKSNVNDDVNGFELPRLVDFVPKSNKNSPVKETYAKLDSIEIVRRFLENEQYNLDDKVDKSIDNSSDDNSWSAKSEFYSREWSCSTSKLATIGEDEEEIAQENDHREVLKHENPILIIENVDTVDGYCEKCVKEQDEGLEGKIVHEVSALCNTARSTSSLTQEIDADEIMDGPRQPPDGHEFPDQENQIEKKMPIIEQVVEKPPSVKPRESWWSKNEPQKDNVRDKIAMFSKPQTTLSKKYVSTNSLPTNSLTRRTESEFQTTPSLFRNNSITYSPSSYKYKTTANITPTTERTPINYEPATLMRKANSSSPRMHGRSISLLDINDDSNKWHDKWNSLIVQRSLSKLKGLVIPENEPDTDENSYFVDLPEIPSRIAAAVRSEPSVNEAPINRRHSASLMNFQIPQPKDSTITLPKYSPAFKRRSFQIHPSNDTTSVDSLNRNARSINANSTTTILDADHTRKPTSLTKTRDFSTITINSNISNDPPKSLESITSPTRSDYSFEFNHVASTAPNTELKLLNNKDKLLTPRSNSYMSDVVASSEYDSDTDSALSSSQSSYLSKTSPPTSPIHIRMESINDVQKRSVAAYPAETAANCENKRLLKPQSLEAINRKNILASAKCRSGRDLKVGSPLIQRKFDEDKVNVEETKASFPSKVAEPKSITVVNEKPIAEIEKDVAPTLLRNNLISPKVNDENSPVPKASLRERFEKPIEPTPRSCGASSYYPNNPIARRASSVTDLRKNFERVAPTPAKRNSTASLITLPPVKPEPVRRTSLPQFKPIPSPAKATAPTATVKPTTASENTDYKCDELVENAIKHFGEDIPKSDVKVVYLKPDVDGGSIGITLAGGADYETKEITIYKIREGSPAFRDGRLQKGDKILAINHKYMKGITHAQSHRILKENVPEVLIIACKGVNGDNSPTSPQIYTKQISFQGRQDITPNATNSNTSDIIEVSIIKDATGLGFSIYGGKGSPQGDIPLVIKKIFMGGAAEKAINLKGGDELLEINHVNVTSMSRLEAWNLMKTLPEQEVTIKVRR